MKINIPDGRMAFIINCRDRVTELRQLIKWLKEVNTYPIKLVIIDNDSKNQDLLKYYTQLPSMFDSFELISLPYNGGKYGIKKMRIISNNPYYIYTDSDIVPTDTCPKDVIPYLISVLEKNKTRHKVALKIKTDDINVNHPLYEDIIKSDKNKYTTLLADSSCYVTLVDTSFALYRNGFSNVEIIASNLVTKEPYTARHLPWYYSTDSFPEDYLFYVNRCSVDSYWGCKLKKYNVINKKIINKIETLNKKDDTKMLVDKLFSYINSIDRNKHTLTFSDNNYCKLSNGLKGTYKLYGCRVHIQWENNTSSVINFDSKRTRFSGYCGKDIIVGKTINSIDELTVSKVEDIYKNQIKHVNTTTKLCMVVSAYKIDNDRINNFIKWNENLFNMLCIDVYMVVDAKKDINCNRIKQVVYPEKQDVFSLSKTINFGIKNIESDSKMIIIKTDIDIIFTSQLITDVTNNVKFGHAYVGLCSYINDESSISSIIPRWKLLNKNEAAKGACFAMTKKDWHLLCGYDERLNGWGAEDYDLYNRCKDKIKITVHSKFPLFHINHKSRINNTYYPDNNQLNVDKINKMQPWVNTDWLIPNSSGKLVTFCLCLKARSSQAIKSIQSLVNDTTAKFFDFIIAEDISGDMLDLTDFKYKKYIQHYVINTNEKWNRSKTCNYAFKRATTPYISTWDADFLFPENFCYKFVSDVISWDFKKHFYAISVTETDDTKRGNTTFSKGQLYGGMFIYDTAKLFELRGYSEDFQLFGFEELDFNSRLSLKYNVHANYIRQVGYVYHMSHDDAMRGSFKNYNINKAKMNYNKQNKIFITNKKWGDDKLMEKINYDIGDGTIVVMGNGPSMKDVNFDLLKNTHTFGMNGAYRWYYKNKWWPTYYGCFDKVVTDCHEQQFKTMIENMEIPVRKYFLLKKISDSHRLKVLTLRGDVGDFSTKFDTFGYGGNTGVNCCQCSLIMGYKKIILIGIDCNYVEIVPGAEIIPGQRLEIKQKMTDNPNYWIPDYQQPGDRYNIPNTKIFHEPAWNKFAEFSKNNGVEVVNCSAISKLTCFRKSTLEKELI